jgi:hypothetical protein
MELAAENAENAEPFRRLKANEVQIKKLFFVLTAKFAVRAEALRVFRVLRGHQNV